MDKLYKIGAWIWRMKERLILGCVCIWLLVSIYNILNPSTAPPAKVPAKKAAADKKAPEEAPGDVMDPPAPVELLKVPAEQLLASNPFTIYGGATASGAPAQGTQEEKKAPEQLPLKVEKVYTGSDGSATARIQVSGARSRAYKQGQEFGKYRLDRIDMANNTVTIWSNEHSRPYTIKAGE